MIRETVGTIFDRAWRAGTQLKLAINKMLAAGIAVAVGLMCAGCLSKPPLRKESFAFPEGSGRINESGGGVVMEIRQIRVDPPFDTQSFVYRTGEYSYERDPYAEFMAPPGEILLPVLRTRLEATGACKELQTEGSALHPNIGAQIEVRELYGDFRDKTGAAAVLRVSFVLTDAKTRKVVVRKDYRERVALRSRTAAALMASWDEALKRIINAMATDITNTNFDSSRLR